MEVRLEKSWQAQIGHELTKPYFTSLLDFIGKEYNQHTCYPPEKDIFNALDLCSFDAAKVIILGQDPYHGEGQAHGLSFSVPKNSPHPPSLINIFKELQNDLDGNYPKVGTLTTWAAQGVLLLNATLSVRAAAAGSHQKQGWERFTDVIINTLSMEKEGLVFMLWGNYAKKKGKHIDRNKHLILESGHPSPLSANRGLWFGNKHFSKANAYLTAHGKKPINW